MSQKNRGVVVVYFSQPKLLDERVINETAKELTAMADKAEHGMLLLNFQSVRFMSSAMLGRLVSLLKYCKTNKISLKLSNVHKEIGEIFKITKMDKLLNLYKDESGAMTAFEKEGWLT